ncbi:MAG: 30S ribosomal protein S6 [Deltaproteobacteria bacterium]|nr:MAG: 30S ribosomal protein S6 [Deltaproteobacteria bacterium]
MRRYETAIVLHPDLGEEAREAVVQRLLEALSQFSGELLDREDWGTRKLAYKINRQERGYYLFLRYTGNPGVVEEVERLLKINEGVLRFLTTKYEKDIKGKYPVPPSIDELLERDLLEFLATKAQWRRRVAPSAEKAETPSPEPVEGGEEPSGE